MAGERRAKISVSVSPLVKKSDNDADDVYTFLHDIKGSLGGTFTIDSKDTHDKWYYAPNIIVTNGLEKGYSDSDRVISKANDKTYFVGSSGNTSDQNEPAESTAVLTDGTEIDASADHIRFVYIKHTGTSDINGTTTTNSLGFNLNNNANALNNDPDAFELRPNEVYISGRMRGTDVDFFCGQSVREDVTAQGATVNGSSSVRISVLALIDSQSPHD